MPLDILADGILKRVVMIRLPRTLDSKLEVLKKCYKRWMVSIEHVLS